MRVFVMSCLLILLRKIDAWISMYVVGLIVVEFLVFLYSGFTSPKSYFLCFNLGYVIMCVSLRCFTDDAESLHADRN